MSHAALRKEARKQHAEKVRAYGGEVSDRQQDEKMIKRAIGEHEAHDHKGEKKTKLHFASGGHVEGDEAPMRPDRQRRASGGATKGGHSTKGTHVNVIVAPRGEPSGPQRPGLGMAPPPGMMPHPMMPPPPPGQPMGMPPGAGGGGMPPGMGAKPFKRGGGVKLEGGAGGGLGRLEKSVESKDADDLHEDMPAVDPSTEDKPAVDKDNMK